MTQIKICGITTEEDAAFAAACGVDAIGFIFHLQSPRYVAPETAKEIIKKLPHGITKVGVFVNLELQEVKEIVSRCGLDMVQLHGAESPTFCSAFPRAQVIKAVALRGADDLEGLRAYPVAAILVDAYDPKHSGGTGKKADWALAAQVKTTHPLILAGGLSLDTIQQAIERCSPQAVDVNSGVEIAPGQKDRAKVKEIIELVHSLGQDGATIFGTGADFRPSER
jgi:phosphoribosylanthranilate isomerase